MKTKNYKAFIALIAAVCIVLSGAVFVSGCGYEQENVPPVIEDSQDNENADHENAGNNENTVNNETPDEGEETDESSGGLKNGGIFEAH